MFYGNVTEYSGTSGTGAFNLDGADGGGLPDAKHTESGGNKTGLTATTWTDVDTSWDLTIPARVGDVIEVGVSALWSNEANSKYLNIEVVESGNLFMPSGSRGASGLWGEYGVHYGIGATVRYTVASGDVNSSGFVVLRLQYKLNNATSSTLYANTDHPFHWFATNLTRRGLTTPQRFRDVLADGEPCYYHARGIADPDEVEEGLGVITYGSPDTLTRYPFGGASAVSFSAGGVIVQISPNAPVLRARHSVLDPDPRAAYEQLFLRDGATSVPSGFSLINGTGVTYSEKYGSGCLIAPATGTHPNYRGMVKSAESGWTAFEASIRWTADDVSTTAGIMLRDSATGEFLTLCYDSNTDTFFLLRYNSPTSFNATTLTQVRRIEGARGFTFRVEKNGATDYDFLVGMDGHGFEELLTAHDPSGFLSIDQLGIAINARDGNVPLHCWIDYHREWT